jgi:hypothetical protein
MNVKNAYSVMPILMHGDASFAGQGVNAEVLQLAGLAGYRTGGTIHIVINNQVGFTTSPHASRTSVYSTDFAKITQQQANELGRLLATNTCVVARNQAHLTVEDELRICEMVGNVEDLSEFAHLPPYSYVLLPGSKGKMQRVTGGLDDHGNPGLFGHVSDLDWHCNMPGVPTRKPLVWLMGVTGTAGSRTSWTNNIMAYNDLSDSMKDCIKDLKMVCGWRKDTYSSMDFGVAKGGITEDFNEHYNPSLVHKHGYDP